MGGSGVIPAWKVKRELTRLGQQLRAIPEFIWEPIACRRHDKAANAGFPVHDGAVPLGAKIALLLVYQPRGIAQSTLSMCAHLRARGYAPFVVSNSVLSASDHATLAPEVWRILERPNFGYDFGGYRDGILQLCRWGIVPEHLLILNDSIWFPLMSDETLVSQLEASDADLSGTILRVRGAERFLESYCYMVPRPTFEHAAFHDYWRDLALTSNKYKVIRRGERGFSRALIAAGLAVKGLYTQSDFMAAIMAQDDVFLEKTLRHAVHTTAGLGAERDRLLGVASAPDWRAMVEAYLRATLEREQIYAAFPYAMIKLFRYPILKKSNDRSAVLWRSAILGAIDSGDLAVPDQPFLGELRCKNATDSL